MAAPGPPDFRASPSRQYTYLVIAIAGGQFLVPALLATFFFTRGVRRHPTLVNYLLSWVFFSISACILLYGGHQGDLIPPNELCAAQVALVNAAYIMISFAAVALMLNLWFTLPAINGIVRPSRPREIILLALPYVTSNIYLIVFYGTRATHPELVRVERGRLTCRFHADSHTRFFLKFTPVLVGVLLNICLAMNVWMFKKTVKHLVSIRDWSFRDMLDSPRGPWFRILLRFTVFCLYALLTEIASLVYIFTPQGPAHDVVDIYVATLPLAAFIIFSTLPDVRALWIWWRARLPSMSQFDIVAGPGAGTRWVIDEEAATGGGSATSTLVALPEIAYDPAARKADPFGKRPRELKDLVV